VIGVIALFFGALAMLALFNGAETGFFRMTRLRLVMEALAGDRVSRIMLWLANRPTLFVGTMLVGTNLSHSALSFALVMAVERRFPGAGSWGEVFATLLVSPLVFIAGDLTPKNLFFSAPNRLMRRVGPVMLVFVVLFAPVTALLWLASLAVQLVTRQKPVEVRLSLARRELGELLSEGHEAGILRPVQRNLAQTMLAVAAQPVKNFAAPAGRIPRVTTSMTRSEVLRIAQIHRRTLLPLEDASEKRQLIGYVRTVDLLLDDSGEPPTPRPLIEIGENESFLSALAKLPVAEDALGHVVSAAGKSVGFVTGRELRLALFRTA
jgi:CBS domain containing-hemolysin-like protein